FSQFKLFSPGRHLFSGFPLGLILEATTKPFALECFFFFELQSYSATLSGFRTPWYYRAIFHAQSSK
ncbi:MAG: hypothetical protein Q7R90_02735, partial [bacterium]|nr:hypothetical protein [bacterium]